MSNLISKSIILSLVVLIGGFGVVGASFDATQKIDYQGKLADGSGSAVADGPYDIVFKLYDAAGGGNTLWTESWTNAALFTDTNIDFTDDGCDAVNHIDKVAYTNVATESTLAAGQYLTNIDAKESAVIQSVNTDSDYICIYDVPSGTWDDAQDVTNRIYVKNGLFSTMLGSISSLSSVEFDQTLYLGVKVGTDDEMTPRKILGAVSAAFEAKQLAGKTWAAPDAIGSSAPNTGAFTTLSSIYSGASTALTVTQSNTGIIAGLLGDSITTGTGLAVSADSLVTGTGMDVSSTSTAGAESGASKLLNLARSGTNSNSSHTAYGLYSSVTNTGTTSTNIAGYFSASGATSNYAGIFASGNVGVGTVAPSNLLDLEKAGTATQTVDLLELTNSGNAASMTDTGTGILFNQWYYDAATPAVADAGRIAALTEGNWTSAGSSQDAYLAFSVALDGTVTERMRITSAGTVGVGTTNPDTNYKLHVNGDSLIDDLLAAGYYESNDTSADFVAYDYSNGYAQFVGDWAPANYWGIGPYSSTAIMIGNVDSTVGEFSSSQTLTLSVPGKIGIGTTDPGQTLTVEGTIGILEGGSSPSYYTVFQGGDQSGNITYTLPTALPASNKALQSSSAGALSWVTADGLTSISQGDSNVTVTDAAYANGYNYRVRIPISHTTAGAQTNYQKQITIVKGSGTNTAGTIYLNDHALSWPNDIRFTKADGETPLDFYREESDDTDGTWYVELDSIASSGDTDFYVYYGKASDTDASSGTDTFIFFDDFENGNLDKWSHEAQWSAQSDVKKEGTYAAKGSYATSNYWLYKTFGQYYTSVATIIYGRVSGVSSNSYQWLTNWQDSSSGSTYTHPIRLYNSHFQYWTGSAWSNLPTDKTYAADTWYRLEYAFDFQTSPCKVRWLYVKDGDAGFADFKTEADIASVQNNRIFFRAPSAEVDDYIDQVMIRNYVYPEPAWASPGSEEESGYISFAEDGSEKMRLTNGNLGIGTTSPGSLLDLEKAGTATQTTNLVELTNSGNAAAMTNTRSSIIFNQYYYNANPAAVNSSRITVGTEGNWTSDSSTQDAYMAFFAGKDGSLTERMRITSAGYVGINTTAGGKTAGSELDVLASMRIAGSASGFIGLSVALAAGSTTYTLPSADGSPGQVLTTNGSGTLSWGSTTGAAISAGDSNLTITDAGDGYISFVEDGSEQMRLTGGQLSIGITTPSNLLDLQKAGTAKANTDIFEITNKGNAASMTGTGTGILFNQWYYDASTPAVANAARIAVVTESDWSGMETFQDAYMGFYTSLDGTVGERMRITSAGYVGIGTTDPQTKLHVVDSDATIATFNRTTDDGTLVSIRYNGAEEGTISVSGETVSYNPFTGSHYAWSEEPLEPGTLVSLTGNNHRLHDDAGSEIIYGVTKTAQANDQKVLGITLGLLEPDEPLSVDNPYLVAVVGNADAWVVQSKTGPQDIEVGDYLVASSSAGSLEKNDPGNPINHIVARALEPIRWADISSTTPEGLKRAKISISFEFFDRPNNLALNNDNVLNESSIAAAGGSAFNDTVNAIKSVFASLGMMIENGIADLKKIAADRLYAKQIQMVDDATGETYCAAIRDGVWTDTEGPCGSGGYYSAGAGPEVTDKENETAENFLGPTGGNTEQLTDNPKNGADADVGTAAPAQNKDGVVENPPGANEEITEQPANNTENGENGGNTDNGENPAETVTGTQNDNASDAPESISGDGQAVP